MKDKNQTADWPHQCRAHNQPTGLLCSRCLIEPLCNKCARRNHGLGYICPGCETELTARYKARMRQTRAAGAAKWTR